MKEKKLKEKEWEKQNERNQIFIFLQQKIGYLSNKYKRTKV